ncbi:tetratricopeptide repeat protein [Gammaproteobacteria bacterium]|nr:tetratricopeptide repeat protein [Gammaproteobacteria bacterium]
MSRLNLQRLLLPLLLFSSGLCGIAYEILYGRLLANIIGDQFLVSTAVLLTFLLGIGLGALYAHRFWRGLWLIEAGIGLYAVLFAVNLARVESLLYTYLPNVGTSAPASLAVAVLLLLVPAFLIGVSLPLFAGYAQQLRPRQGYFAASYAVYNFGAAATVIIVEFWLIRQVGIRQTVLYMGALNGLVALVLLTLYAQVARGAARGPKLSSSGFSRVLLAALAISSIASAIFQLSAVRLSELLLGPYRETFAYILCIVLAGIALGSLLVNWFRIRFVPVMIANILALCWILGGLTLVMQFYAQHYQQLADSYWLQVGFKLLCISVLFLGPAMTFGATIPALLNTLQASTVAQGRDAARSPGYLLFVASLANAAGFLLMFLVLHKQLDYGDLLLLVALLSAVSLLLAALSFDEFHFLSIKKSVLAAGLVLGLTLLLASNRLAWNEELLYQGHYSFKSLALMEQNIGAHATSERYKGEQDVLSISRRDGKSFFFINGQISIHLEKATEKIVGAISAVFAADHRRALVLGVGSGATAGTVGLLFDEVEAVEISGVILDNLPRLKEHNFGIADMRNVTLVHDDAIHAVQLAEGNFSLILNTVTSPLFFSSSKLYTVEFLANVRSKLAPGGLYMTWFDFRVGDRGAGIMLESVTSSFAHCGLAQLNSAYLLLLCSDAPIVAHHPLAVAEQPRLAAYFRDKHEIDPAGIAYQLIHTDAGSLIGPVQVPLNTLDYPALEFEMARLKKRSLAELQSRIVDSIDRQQLGNAFRHFDWDLGHMLRSLRKTTGPNIYYQKLDSEHQQYRKFFDAGLNAYRRGDCEWADTMIARALALQGRLPSPQLRRAHCYEMQGMYPQALQAYNLALEQDSQNSRINLLLARVYISMDRLAAAHAELRQVAANEQGVAYHYMMGKVLKSTGEATAAERHYARATILSGSRELAPTRVDELTAE